MTPRDGLFLLLGLFLGVALMAFSVTWQAFRGWGEPGTGETYDGEALGV